MNCPSCQASNEDNSRACWSCGLAFALPPPVSKGALISGRYEIAEALGQGGMGTVYRAHDRMLDEHVAIKILRVELQASAERGRRFRSEIKLARKVTHRNVCRIHEYGEDGSIHYICMELVEGNDLKHLLSRGRLPASEAFGLAKQVAEGLEAIHQVGVIHRDLKPSNIMLDRSGVAKLMDFGIAKQWGAEGDAGTTGAGHIVGTPDYMSPEQARGERIDFRSDVYCLGVLTYELFTGVRPFKSPTPLGTILKHINEPAPLSGALAGRIPSPVVPILERALAKDREARYATAGAMLMALEQASAAHAASSDTGATPLESEDAVGSETPTSTSFSLEAAPARAKRRWRSGALAGVGLAALGVAVLDLRWEAPPDEAREDPRVAAPLAGVPSTLDTPPPTLPPAKPRPPKEIVASGAAPLPGRIHVTPQALPSPVESPSPAAPPSVTPTTQAIGAGSTAPAEPAPTTVAPAEPASDSERAAIAEPGNPAPTYPREARAKGLEGQVTLKVAVSENGGVGEVAVLSGEEPFVSAALDAVRRWRYSPATREGRNIPSEVIVRIPFRLRRKG